MNIRSTYSPIARRYGVCHATMQYGPVVQFWCEALDGDSTDVCIVSVDMPSVEVATAVTAAASWNGASPARGASGPAIAFDDTVIEFRDADTVRSVLSAAYANI